MSGQATQTQMTRAERFGRRIQIDHLALEAMPIDDTNQVIELMRTQADIVVRLAAFLKFSWGHAFAEMTTEDWIREAEDILKVIA